MQGTRDENKPQAIELSELGSEHLLWQFVRIVICLADNLPVAGELRFAYSLVRYQQLWSRGETQRL